MSLRAALTLLLLCSAVPAQAPPTPGAPPAGVPPAGAPKPAAPAQSSPFPSSDTMDEADTSVPSAQAVLARRLADVVAIREGPRSPERVLYYFNPTVNLVEGGHLEQGSGGHSEVALFGGGVLSMHANGHIELIRLAEDGDVIRLPVVTRLDVRAGARPLELQLPGDTTVQLVKDDLMLVQLEPGRLRIRNQGAQLISVNGDLRLTRQTGDAPNIGHLDLKAGEEVLMPLFGVAGLDEGTVTDLWGWVVVRHTAGSTVTMEGDQLHVVRDPGSSEPTEALEVRGVYTLASGDDQLVIHDPGFVERPPEPPLAAPAEPATSPAAPPAEPAVAPPGDTTVLPPEGAPTDTPQDSPPETPPDAGGEPPKTGGRQPQETSS